MDLEEGGSRAPGPLEEVEASAFQGSPNDGVQLLHEQLVESP